MPKAWRFTAFLIFALLSRFGPPQAHAQGTGATAPVLTAEQAEVKAQAEAQSLIQRGMLSEAEKNVRAFLTAHANSAEGHYLLGQILFREAKAKDSLAEYTEGAKYRRPRAAELKLVALDYVLLHDYFDADKWLTMSVGWDPKDAESWYYLGRAKYSENRFDEAIAAFERCLKLDPKNIKAEDNLGLSYQGLGRSDEAAAAYKKAIEWQSQLAPNDTSMPVRDSGAYLDLGILLVDKERAQEAVPYLLEAIEITPNDPRGHEQLGKAYGHLDRLEKAQAELQKAIELDSQNARLHFLLGQIYRREGMMEKAKSEFDRYSTLHDEPAPK